jgi:hypothetical protein
MGRVVDQEVESWHTHQAYLAEGPRAAEMLYKRISMAKEQDARKWIQQKEKGWKIIIDHLPLDIERDLQRVPGYGDYMMGHNVRWLWLEVRKIETGQGSFSIARTMKKLQSIKIERDEWRAYFDVILTSWRKIETMPGSWEDKFKESFTSLFIEGMKTMKDPKRMLTSEITAQMARDRYENWDILLQRWATILKNSEDYEEKKDQRQAKRT